MSQPKAGGTFDMEQAFALKAVVQYLCNARLAAETAMFAELNIDGADADARIKAGRQFMRTNAGMDTVERLFPVVRAATRQAIAAGNIPVPSFLRRAAERCGVVAPLVAHSVELPSFIDAERLHNGDIADPVIATILRRYAGFWRVYRVSTNSEAGEIHLNVSLLNIKPPDVLNALARTVPEFSLYQHDAADDDPTNYAQASGVLLRTGDRIALLGEGAQPHAGIADLCLLTWKFGSNYDAQAPHSQQFRGLACLRSTEGTQIACYFLAEFIAGTEHLARSEFAGLRERQIPTLGSRPKAVVEQGISEGLRQALDRLIADSSSRSVFSL